MNAQEHEHGDDKHPQQCPPMAAHNLLFVEWSGEEEFSQSAVAGFDEESASLGSNP